jgi:predicted AAA+ superfamily ATPase
MVQQLIKNEKITLEQVVFIDFTLYENGIIDPMLLLQEYYELFPDKQPFFVFDEIQEIANFKEFVLALFIQQHKIFLSGSNSRLLSSELSTQFRGRIYEFQVQPLVATEIFSFHTIPRKAHYSMLESAKINHLYQKVLHFGSFPEVVMIDDEFTKADLLK